MKPPYQLWRNLLKPLMAAALLAVVAACGGGGGDVTLPVSPPANTNLPLSIEVLGTGTVSSQPEGINCSDATCLATFAPDTAVTLTATPGAGQSFAGWSGACSGSVNTCVVTMDAARVAATPDVTARFAPTGAQATYTFSLTIAGLGKVASNPAGIDCTANCSAVFAANTQVTLTATPAAGQNFAGWSGACAGAASSCTVTVDQARTTGAAFQPITGTNFALNVAVSGSGSVASSPAGINCGSACSANFAAGTAVTLTATPAAGQQFTSWGGACSGTQPTCALQLTQVRAVQAVFAAAPVASAFQTPQLLEASNDFNVQFFKVVAVNNSGDSIAVWEQSDGVPNGETIKVYSRRYTQATGWQPAVLVPGMSRRQSNPSLTVSSKLLMDDAGVATWIRPNMETRRNLPTTGWGAVFSPPNTGAALNVMTSAVMDRVGGIGVLTSGSDIYHSALVAGASTWAAWQQLDTSGPRVAWKADFAQSGNGTALAVWHEANPGDSNYSMKSAFWNGSAWGAPQSIETLTANLDEERPKVVMDDQGNGIAMWLQKSGNIQSTVFYNIYRAGSGWQGEIPVAELPDFFPSNSDLQLTMAADGRAVATWLASGGSSILVSMQYAPATGWTTPVRVTTDPSERAYFPQIFISNSGQAVVTYETLNLATARTDLFTRSLNFGGQWSAALPLVGGAGGIQSAKFAMNKTGQGVVLWSQGDQAGRDQRISLWSSVLR